MPFPHNLIYEGRYAEIGWRRFRDGSELFIVLDRRANSTVMFASYEDALRLAEKIESDQDSNMLAVPQLVG